MGIFALNRNIIYTHCIHILKLDEYRNEEIFRLGRVNGREWVMFRIQFKLGNTPTYIYMLIYSPYIMLCVQCTAHTPRLKWKRSNFNVLTG